MFTSKRGWLCKFASAVFVLYSALHAGCEAQPSKETIGTGLGALVGGIVGSQFGGGHGQTARTIGGMLIGGAIGNVIGKHMDEEDHRRMAEALNANSSGQSSSWKNATTGASYTVTPGEMFDRNGQQCRAFTQEAIIDGELKKISGTACRRPDGTSWDAA